MLSKFVSASLFAFSLYNSSLFAATLTCENGPSFTPISFKLTLNEKVAMVELFSQSSGFYPGEAQSLANLSGQDRHKDLFLDSIRTVQFSRTACPEIKELGQAFSCTLPKIHTYTRGTGTLDELDPPIILEDFSSTIHLYTRANLNFKVIPGQTEDDPAIEFSGSFIEPVSNREVPFLVKVNSLKKRCWFE